MVYRCTCSLAACSAVEAPAAPSAAVREACRVAASWRASAASLVSASTRPRAASSATAAAERSASASDSDFWDSCAANPIPTPSGASRVRPTGICLGRGPIRYIPTGIYLAVQPSGDSPVAAFVAVAGGYLNG
eukprot:1195319-Prorocentrum_minimum.AAC.5